MVCLGDEAERSNQGGSHSNALLLAHIWYTIQPPVNR
jgi:hypothetical protein